VHAATASWIFPFALGLCSIGCAAHAGAPRASDVRAAPSGGSSPPPSLAVPTPEERDLAVRLKTTVEHLSVKLGERNMEKSWNYASATDDIARDLEKLGYEARRQGYAIGTDVVQNIEAKVPGGRHGDESVVVGAHYDTERGSPGADDNASGVAAVFELARMFREKKPSRTLRFVFFANEEAPYSQTEQMGSLVYAKDLVAHGTRVVAMLSLESIGYFSSDAGSQHYPPELASRYPTVGDFIAVVGNEASRPLLDNLTQTLKRSATLPVVGDVLPDTVPDGSRSDHWSFWKLGIPAVMITDTAPFRNPHYHKTTDLPDVLDFDRMSRVVAGLAKVLDVVSVGDPVPGE
jgi:Peptidase family M28